MRETPARSKYPHFCLLLLCLAVTILTRDVVVVEGFVPQGPQNAMRILKHPLPQPKPFRQSVRSFATIEEKPTITDGSEDSEETKKFKLYRLPKIAYKIYTTYAKKLWRETDVENRKRIASDELRSAIRNMQHVLGDEYSEFSKGAQSKARDGLRSACEDMLKTLPDDEAVEDPAEKMVLDHQQTEDIKESVSSKEVALIDSSATKKSTESKEVAPKKKHRSILFGAVMGAAVACWVFSGNYIFTGLFCLMTILGQLEYYRMVMNTGIYPARRISVVGASSMFLTALFAPNLHQICLPMFGLWAMIWFLTMRRKVTTISEIATTFTGMFYLGYVPSFWVRVRLIGAGMEPTRVAPWMGPFREFLKNRFDVLIPSSLIHLPFTTGAVFIFWSWLSLAFSDVGAYFVGRKFGKTKLGQIAPAAGAASPNKSVEGVLGGCAASAFLSIIGAWVQKWPYFVFTGALHGTILGLLGLIGDLTASMLKRDAGLKDFGDLIPEHGGIMDRVDSFVWTAPYSWVVCAYVIPALKQALM